MYQRWKTGFIKHLWIFGKAGCGKTVICSTAIEDMKEHCENQDEVGFAVFYFTFSDQKKQTYEDLLRSLAAQLGSKGPGLAILQQAYDQTNGGSLDETRLEEIVITAAKAYTTTFVMLDALDESPEESDSREDMLKGLEKLAEGSFSLRICATSREPRDIRDTMKTLQAETMSIDTAAINADIKRYVSNRLSNDRRLVRIKEASKALILKTILEKADGAYGDSDTLINYLSIMLIIFQVSMGTLSIVRASTT
jgi:Cdc6-like AAA superfamily ATPase